MWDTQQTLALVRLNNIALDATTFSDASDTCNFKLFMAIRMVISIAIFRKSDFDLLYVCLTYVSNGQGEHLKKQLSSYLLYGNLVNNLLHENATNSEKHSALIVFAPWGKKT